MTLRLTTNVPVSHILDERTFRLEEPIALFLGPDEPFQGEVLSTAERDAERHHRLLARVGAHPGRAAGVAGGGDPRGHHAEAVRLRGDRRHRRGADHLDPRGARQRPQLGLSLLLDPRRLLRGPGAEPPGRGGHPGELSRLSAQHHRRGRRRPHPAGLWRRLRADPHRADRRHACPATAAWARSGSATRRTSTSSTTSTARSSCPPSRPSSTSGCCGRPRATISRRWRRWASGPSRCYDKPDAGLWELRTRAAVHTYSAAMCWAACDRLANAAEKLGLTDRASSVDGARGRSSGPRIEARAWNAKGGHFAATFGGDELDASLTQLVDLRFLAPGRSAPSGDPEGDRDSTCGAGSNLLRYDLPDDFGAPETAFNFCTFWFIEALHLIGETDEARRLFEEMLTRRNHAGLLSEDVSLDRRRALGELSADLLACRDDQLRRAAEPPLEFGPMSRLIVVSNRVNAPESQRRGAGRRPGRGAVRRRCGNIRASGSAGAARRVETFTGEVHTRRRRRRHRRHGRSRGGRLPGILQRLRQRDAVAAVPLPDRPDRLRPLVRRGLRAGEPALRRDPRAR